MRVRSSPPTRASWARATSSATAHGRGGPHLLQRGVELHDPGPVGVGDRRSDAVHSRDRRLEREPAVPGCGERSVVEPGAQQALVPAGAVDVVERHRQAGLVDARRTSGQSQADDCPQPAHLRVRREQGDQCVGDRQGLPAQVGERVARVEQGAVRDGEHPRHAVQDDRQPDSTLLGAGHPELAARLRQGLLRPREPGRRGALLDAEVHGGLGDAQPADDAQCEHHLRARRQCLVARDEQEGQPVVEGVGQLTGVHVSRRLLGCQLRHEAREGAAPTSVVDPGALGDVHAPGRQVVDVVSDESPRDRLRGVLLGIVQAARPRRQDAHDARPGGPELLAARVHHPMLVDVRRNRGAHLRRLHMVGKTLRHSIVPPVGTSAAILRAVASSSTSTA